MPARSKDKRWNSKLARFIDAFGVDQLALQLGLRHAAIYQWVSGRTSPRVVHALRIVRLAKQRGIELSVADIYKPDSH